MGPLSTKCSTSEQYQPGPGSCQAGYVCGTIYLFFAIFTKGSNFHFLLLPLMENLKRAYMHSQCWVLEPQIYHYLADFYSKL